jgi:PPOX class probable F420-dependent enzyme
MARRPVDLDPESLAFLSERHLATLTTLRADGAPHVVAVGFSYDAEAGLVRVITGGGSQKVRNIDRGSRAAVCQIDGGRWLSLEGPAVVRRDAAAVAEAVRRYAERYQPPRPNDTRVAIEIAVERILGRS